MMTDNLYFIYTQLCEDKKYISMLQNLLTRTLGVSPLCSVVKTECDDIGPDEVPIK